MRKTLVYVLGALHYTGNSYRSLPVPYLYSSPTVQLYRTIRATGPPLICPALARVIVRIGPTAQTCPTSSVSG